MFLSLNYFYNQAYKYHRYFDGYDCELKNLYPLIVKHIYNDQTKRITWCFNSF